MQFEFFVYTRVVHPGSDIERPTRLVNEPPAQCAINQSQVYLFMDVVDHSVDLCAVGKTQVNYFAEYSERTFLRLCPHRKNHVKVLQNVVEKPDVYICVDPADSNRPVHPRHPTGRRDCEPPGLAFCNGWRRGFFRLQFQRARVERSDERKACACE